MANAKKDEEFEVMVENIRQIHILGEGEYERAKTRNELKVAMR